MGKSRKKEGYVCLVRMREGVAFTSLGGSKEAAIDHVKSSNNEWEVEHFVFSNDHFRLLGEFIKKYTKKGKLEESDFEEIYATNEVIYPVEELPKYLTPEMAQELNDRWREKKKTEYRSWEDLSDKEFSTFINLVRNDPHHRPWLDECRNNGYVPELEGNAHHPSCCCLRCAELACIDSELRAIHAEITENDIGVVYVLSNPSFREGILKIGYAGYDLVDRIRGLNRSTSIPLPFEFLFGVKCRKPRLVEQRTHRILKEYMVNQSKEFFIAPPGIIKETIFRADAEIRKKEGITYGEMMEKMSNA